MSGEHLFRAGSADPNTIERRAAINPYAGDGRNREIMHRLTHEALAGPMGYRDRERITAEHAEQLPAVLLLERVPRSAHPHRARRRAVRRLGMAVSAGAMFAGFVLWGSTAGGVTFPAAALMGLGAWSFGWLERGRR